MSHTSDKIGKWIYNKFFGSIQKEHVEAIEKTRIDERKFADDRVNRVSASFLEGDPFYAKFPQKVDDYKFDLLEKKYHGDKKKDLFRRGSTDRAQMVDVIEATGWSPYGYDQAAFRIGSVDELSTIQDACFKKYMLDPLGKSIVMNMQYFTVGQGVKVSSVSEEVNDWLTEFRTYNRMGRREKKMVRSSYIEGEYFLAYVKDGIIISNY